MFLKAFLASYSFESIVLCGLIMKFSLFLWMVMDSLHVCRELKIRISMLDGIMAWLKNPISHGSWMAKISILKFCSFVFNRSQDSKKLSKRNISMKPLQSSCSGCWHRRRRFLFHRLVFRLKSSNFLVTAVHITLQLPITCLGCLTPM